MKGIMLSTFFLVITIVALYYGGKIASVTLFGVTAWCIIVGVGAVALGVQAEQGKDLSVKVPADVPKFIRYYNRVCFGLTALCLAAHGFLGWIVATLWLIHWCFIVGVNKTLREHGYIK